MNNAISIEYASAPCGAGKTHAICEYISKNIDKKFLIVLPTIELGDDYCLKLEAKGVKTIVCNNNSLTSGSVAKKLKKK